MGCCASKSEAPHLHHKRKLTRPAHRPASAQAAAAVEARVRVCDGCGEKVAGGLCRFCPLKLRVAAEAGGLSAKISIHEVVAKRLEEEARTLEGFKHRSPALEYPVVRIQRWWRRCLLYRRWFGTIFKLLWRKLDKWGERRRLRFGFTEPPRPSKPGCLPKQSARSDDGSVCVADDIAENIYCRDVPPANGENAGKTPFFNDVLPDSIIIDLEASVAIKQAAAEAPGWANEVAADCPATVGGGAGEAPPEYAGLAHGDLQPAPNGNATAISSEEESAPSPADSRPTTNGTATNEEPAVAETRQNAEKTSAEEETAASPAVGTPPAADDNPVGENVSTPVAAESRPASVGGEALPEGVASPVESRPTTGGEAAPSDEHVASPALVETHIVGTQLAADGSARETFIGEYAPTPVVIESRLADGGTGETPSKAEILHAVGNFGEEGTAFKGVTVASPAGTRPATNSAGETPPAGELQPESAKETPAKSVGSADGANFGEALSPLVASFPSLFMADAATFVDESSAPPVAWEPMTLHSHERKHDIVRSIVYWASNRRGIPEVCAHAILNDALEVIKQRTPVQRVRVRGDEQCVVVGDIHGQLGDLLRILETYGLPGPKRYYIFNGDLVDRSWKGCEVTLIVLTLLIAFPRHVFINRGNHEDVKMNVCYTFYWEATCKFELEGYEKFAEVFYRLPLCTTVNDEVFVVHGGVPRDKVTVDDIDKLKFPHDIANVFPGNVSTRSLAERVQADMLWSDPLPAGNKSCTGPFSFNEERGTGIWFTAQHTQAFLEKNKLTCVIRSHQAPQAGFSIAHGGKMITVFSASYYADVMRNDGAVAVLQTSDDVRISQRTDYSCNSSFNFAVGKLNVGFDTWKIYDYNGLEPILSGIRKKINEKAESPPKRKPSAMSQVVRVLQEFIHDHRHVLLSTFQNADRKRPGAIGCLEWAAIMRSASGCSDMPWAFMRHLVASAVFPEKLPGHKPGDTIIGTCSVSYFANLKQFNVPLQLRLFERWAPYLVRYIHCILPPSVKLCDAFRDEVEMQYAMFFETVVDLCWLPLPVDYVFHLFCYLGADSKGCLTKEKCRATEELVQSKGVFMGAINEHGVGSVGKDDESTEKKERWTKARDFYMWDLWLAQRLRELASHCISPTMAFTLFDQDGDGEFGKADLLAVLNRLSTSALRCPGRRVKYKFSSQPSSQAYENELAEVEDLMGVPDKLLMDPDGVMVATFYTWPLSDNLASKFLTLLDTDGDGRVTYTDFLHAFFVYDAECESSSLLLYAEPPIPVEHFWQVGDESRRSSFSRRDDLSSDPGSPIRHVFLPI
ncbi:Serine/threonine-protein phosphatase T [Diplonema papillatum]|nr:Serine/threonine-protein phosphatase T [Diplonema papillatum]